MLIVPAIVMSAAALFFGVGWILESRSAARQRHRILREARRRSTPRADIDLERLDNVPDPVARYLRNALPARPHAIRIARMVQRGRLRTDGSKNRWWPFQAEHVATTNPTAFLWNARVSIAPAFFVRVRDAFIAGQGSGRVALWSGIAISRQASCPEMNSGALHRYLAESVWYPTALIPGENLEWAPLGGDRAVATLSVGETTVSLEFRFTDADEVDSVHAPQRWGRFGGEFRQVAWEGRFESHQRHQGFLVPSQGAVGWMDAEDVWHPVWKGEIESMTYELDE